MEDYRIEGEVDLDKYVWTMFCKFHGEPFDNLSFMYIIDKMLICFAASLGYSFAVYILTQILLSRTDGTRVSNLYSTPERMVKSAESSFVWF